jgi:hypothetical protein
MICQTNGANRGAREGVQPEEKELQGPGKQQRGCQIMLWKQCVWVWRHPLETIGGSNLL